MVLLDVDPDARVVQAVENHGQGGRVFLLNGKGAGDQRGRNEGNGGCALMVNEGRGEGAHDWSWSLLAATVRYTDRGASNQFVENQGNGGFAVQLNSQSPVASGQSFRLLRIDPGTFKLDLAGQQQAYYLPPTRCRVVIDLAATHSQLLIGTALAVSAEPSEHAGGIGNINANLPAMDGSNNNNNNNANTDGSRNNNNSNNNSMAAALFPGGLAVTVSGDHNQIAFAYGAGASMQLRDETAGASALGTPVVLALPSCDPPPSASGTDVVVEGSGNQVVLQEGNGSGILQRNRGSGEDLQLPALNLSELNAECPLKPRGL